MLLLPGGCLCSRFRCPAGFFFCVLLQQLIGGLQLVIQSLAEFLGGVLLQLRPLFMQQLQLAVEFRVIAHFVQITGLSQQLFQTLLPCLLLLLQVFLLLQALFAQAVNGFVFAFGLGLQLLQCGQAVDAFGGGHAHGGNRMFHGQRQALLFIGQAAEGFQTAAGIGFAENKTGQFSNRNSGG